MTPKATQEELQAATNATLRAHATSDVAKALVVRLAAMVDVPKRCPLHQRADIDANIKATTKA